MVVNRLHLLKIIVYVIKKTIPIYSKRMLHEVKAKEKEIIITVKPRSIHPMMLRNTYATCILVAK